MRGAPGARTRRPARRSPPRPHCRSPRRSSRTWSRPSRSAARPSPFIGLVRPQHAAPRRAPRQPTRASSRTSSKGMVLSGSPTVTVGGKPMATTIVAGVDVHAGPGPARRDRSRRDGRREEHGHDRGVHRPRLGIPAAHRRDRRDRPRLARARDRGGDPARSSERRPASGRCGPSSAAGSTTTSSASPTARPPTRSRPRSSAPLGRWEPRIDVQDVVVSFDALDQTLLYIDVRYSLRRTNDRRNLVFPFYVIPGEGGRGMTGPADPSAPAKRSDLTWPSRSPISTTAASRTSSTTRSASSSSAAPSGPTTTSRTPASR